MELKDHVFDLDVEALAQRVTAMGLAKYRAQQVLDWVYRKHEADPRKFKNIAKADREALAGALRFTTGSVVTQQSASDGVEKLLVQWEGVREPAAQTECVMIPTPERRTACVSSQVGCPVGCRFCASGLGGLEQNLTAGQIVEQVWLLDQLTQTTMAARVSNVVFMGMGEPLANYDNVVRAVRTLMADWGLNLSGRRITISTVGLPAQMRRLADEDIPATLAISLHAPNDEVRRKLIPWAQYVTIAQLLEAGRYYFEKTGREVTLEYTLLRGVNDQPEHARQLATLARSLRSHVNLIRYNEVRGVPFNRPDDAAVLGFEKVLRKASVNTHIRASRGRDIAAACGQLRHETTPLRVQR